MNAKKNNNRKCHELACQLETFLKTLFNKYPFSGMNKIECVRRLKCLFQIFLTPKVLWWWILLGNESSRMNACVCVTNTERTKWVFQLVRILTSANIKNVLLKKKCRYFLFSIIRMCAWGHLMAVPVVKNDVHAGFFVGGDDSVFQRISWSKTSLSLKKN